MTKSSLLLLVVTLIAISGWLNPAQASIHSTAPRTSSCSSMMVSTPLCDEFLAQSCFEVYKTPEKPQIQPSVIILSSKEAQTEVASQTQAVAAPSAQPTQTPSIQATNLDSDKIFDLVNQYRSSLGLTPYERENSVCELAQIRSSELAGELANGIIHSGLYNRNLPYWIWENAKVGSNEEETVSWWISSPIHRESIVGDYKYSCVKCTGSNCSQLFTSFSPK